MDDENADRIADIQDLKTRAMVLEGEVEVVEQILRSLALEDDFPYEAKLLQDSIAIKKLVELNHGMTASRRRLKLRPNTPRHLQPEDRHFVNLVKSKISGVSRQDDLVYHLPNFFQFHPQLITEYLQKSWIFYLCPAGPSFGDDGFPNSVIPKHTWKLRKDVTRIFDREHDAETLIEVGKKRCYEFGNFLFEVYRVHSTPDPTRKDEVGWAIGCLTEKMENQLPAQPTWRVGQSSRQGLNEQSREEYLSSEQGGMSSQGRGSRRGGRTNQGQGSRQGGRTNQGQGSFEGGISIEELGRLSQETRQGQGLGPRTIQRRNPELRQLQAGGENQAPGLDRSQEPRMEHQPLASWAERGRRSGVHHV